MSSIVRKAGPEDFGSVVAFLREDGYPIEVNPADTFYVAVEHDVMIGVVRLAREFQHTVLRGMRVAPSTQRQGVGTRLLQLVQEDLVDTDCYCLPYTHLIDFFAQIGFRVVDPHDAPAHLSRRIAGYQAHAAGAQFALMYRPHH
jgi:N-acetylglutamate synthase-like GNAT family acetyltransferase